MEINYLYIGEWWKKDVVEVYNELRRSRRHAAIYVQLTSNLVIFIHAQRMVYMHA